MCGLIVLHSMVHPQALRRGELYIRGAGIQVANFDSRTALRSSLVLPEPTSNFWKVYQGVDLHNIIVRCTCILIDLVSSCSSINKHVVMTTITYIC